MSKYDVQIDINAKDESHAMILRQIQPGSSVLEFGSATGGMTQYMCEVLDCDVCIVEIDEQAYEQARKWASDGICGNIEDYAWLGKFCDKKFDYILFADVLEHLSNPYDVVLQARALLKEEGEVIASVPNMAYSGILAELCQNQFQYRKTGLLDKTHIHFFAYQSFVNLFYETGYCITVYNATHCPLKDSEFKTVIPRLVPDQLDFLKTKSLADVYQFVFTAVKAEYYEQNKGLQIQDMLNISEERSQAFTGTGLEGKVYFECGTGISEENCICLEFEVGKPVHQEIQLPKDCKTIRFDPTEGTGCLIWNLQIRTESTFLRVRDHNGIQLNDVYVFRSADPQIYVEELPAGSQFLNIDAEIITMDQSAWIKLVQEVEALGQQCETFKQTVEAQERHIQNQNDLIEDKERHIQNQNNLIEDRERYIKDQNDLIEDKERRIQNQNNLIEDKDRCIQNQNNLIEGKDDRIRDQNGLIAQQEQELAYYKTHYLAAIGQREDLSRQLAEVQNAYNIISNATFWKITAPFRAVLDFMKRILKSNRYTRVFYKGLKCLKENGFRYTWNRIWRGRGYNYAPSAALPGTSPGNSDYTVKFSILVPLYNTAEKYLREMIESVTGQSYTHWELCLTDGSDDTHPWVETICMEYAEKDSRIKYKKLPKNGGISNNSNACAEMAAGDYIVLLDHDDLLMPNALLSNARAITETGADVLYSDEDHLSAKGEHISPFFKPDWSPDLLYSQMYVCHLFVFRRELFVHVGGFRSEFDGSQDYDLMLRLSECTDRICHIPEVLYSWRESETSTAANTEAKPYAHLAGKRAIDEHLKRKYGTQAYAEETEYLFVYNARFRGLPPLVSIIIPFRDKWKMTNDCIGSILKKSTYVNYEILLLNNRSVESDTAVWIREIQKKDRRIRVIDADMEFNWSRLNNFGISHAKGDVLIFLNNDTLIISKDWIERLSEHTIRDNIGAVGGLLLYPDDTIQHAGVVVGMDGWAGHIFKDMPPVHYGSPFVSPMVSRNVLAVTGACMAMSRKAVEKVGLFDEEFIICGSDVEWCIRAHEKGLFNRYDANVKLYHLESKSRDAHIPEVDFQKSYVAYTPYRENIDPYFNINLDRTSAVPKERLAPMNLVNFKNFLKRCPVTASAYQVLRATLMSPQDYQIPEIEALHSRKGAAIGSLRLNLLIPSVDQRHFFGGISTAIKFFEILQKQCRCPARLIVTDAPVLMETSIALEGYVVCDSEQDSDDMLQIIPMNDRSARSIPVAENDVFVATGWWTAYIVSDVIQQQSKEYGCELRPLIYLIQDYEPGFYPWSSRYMMADSTYRMEIPTYAVMNSDVLAAYFQKNGYIFQQVWQFAPTLNESLRAFLPDAGQTIPKKKQILVYGRPSIARNAFELLIYSLKNWCSNQADAKEWTLLSAGEAHDDVDLGNGMVLHSVGKLSLDKYAKTLLDTYAGISLMVSPHPSYPPLEMAAFGVRVITNRYGDKDLSEFSENITSLQPCSPANIARTLENICDAFTGEGRVCVDVSYISDDATFDGIPEQIAALICNME